MDRSTAQDLSMLWPDDFGWPQDIDGLATLDGSALFDADGRFRLDHVRTVIEARLHLVPRFRQVLYFPRGDWDGHCGWTLRDSTWRTMSGSSRYPHRVMRRSFCRPWSSYVGAGWIGPGRCGRCGSCPGCQRGGVGFFLKVHHTIADGVAGVATLGAFVDTVPDPPVSPAPAWTPAPAPSARELLEDNLRSRLAGLGRAVSACTHPVATMGHLRDAWPAMRETFADGRAPRTSLNRPIGSDRRLAVVRGHLDVVRRVAHAHDATVNDALMAAIAGGFRDLLRSRRECVEGLVLRGYVPVSLHREQPGQARGNLDGMMVVPLPVGVPDTTDRLRLVAAATTTRRN